VRVTDKGEGTVAVKKPGRMRWDYTKPEKQQILSDGSHIYSCYRRHEGSGMRRPAADAEG
jgi:outer membrane lipoprotein-sorting protein